MGTDITKIKKQYRTQQPGDFPDHLVMILEREHDLKYGENPNQPAAIYIMNGVADIDTVINNVLGIDPSGRMPAQAVTGRFLQRALANNAREMADLTNLRSVREDGKGKGGMSLANYVDISRGMDSHKFFLDQPTALLLKHHIVSGFATGNQALADLYRTARDCDRQSNFGGTLVVNRPLDMETAQAMFELQGESVFFVDVVAAPGYEEGVLGYLQEQKKNLRIAEFEGMEHLPKFQGDDPKGLLSIKEMPSGRVGVQDLYLTSIKGPGDLITDPLVRRKGEEYVIERPPTETESQDLLTAWYLNIAGARSNGIVVVKDGVLVGMGSGKVERFGAVKDAIIQGAQKGMDREGIEYDPLGGVREFLDSDKNSFTGASLSSDAFFPFDDSVQLAYSAGVTAIVQPYGSQNDNKVIQAANKLGMAMPATLERCFGHF